MPHILIYDCEDASEIDWLRSAIGEAVGASRREAMCDVRLSDRTGSYHEGNYSTLLTVDRHHTPALEPTKGLHGQDPTQDRSTKED